MRGATASANKQLDQVVSMSLFCMHRIRVEGVNTEHLNSLGTYLHCIERGVAK